MEKRFKVISIHYTTKCNMNCPFCYKKRTDESEEKPLIFWYNLVPYVSKLTEQIALGGGEPFTNINFIKKFGKVCRENNLILNITSNGKLLMPLSDKELRSVLKNITMVSLSFDEHKIKTSEDSVAYHNLVNRIKRLTKTQVGTNLLISEKMFEEDNFVKLVDFLFTIGIDRVFALCPKNFNCPDVLKFKEIYLTLTKKYPTFFVDDLTKMILEEKKYGGWEKSCHYGKEIVSINEKGFVMGCSFDLDDDALLKLENPKDILKIKNIKTKERFSCPYLVRK